MGKWCPATKEDCNKECVLFRSGVRLFEDGKKPEPFEECAINIAVDCLENLVGRSVGQQQATEQVRNETAKLRAIFEVAFTGKILEKSKNVSPIQTKKIGEG